MRWRTSGAGSQPWSGACAWTCCARAARREELTGEWLPEPVVTGVDAAGDPEEQALLADSVGVALLVVLETLTPAERLAFVLHDMFAVPFEDIAPVVGRSAAAARQLASRARRRVRGALPVAESDLARQREVVDAFLAASRAGDFEALVAVLDPDVVFRADSPRAGETPVYGAAAVAQRVLARGSRFARFGRPVLVGGAAGVLVAPAGRPIALAAFTVVEGRIAEIDMFVDPDRIRRLV